MRIKLALITLALVATSGCTTHYLVNDPVDEIITEDRIDFISMRDADKRASETIILLTFSGGGTRAAALAYGVLETLRDTPIKIDGKPARMLDEVDLISSVSGGSFTSAYYGLHGDGIFEDFEERFLYKNIQGQLFGRVLSPGNWFRLPSKTFSRSDMAAELYDDEVFDGYTFADLRDRTSTAILINATDSTAGSAFTFRQLQFDLICSDLATYPISRAVAASSAVPGLFGAITLNNYAGQCGLELAPWVSETLAGDKAYTQEYRQARSLTSYADPDKRPYIHLMDGGLADNLGIRAITNQIVALGGIVEGAKVGGFDNSRRIAVIVVNAETASQEELNYLQRLPLSAQLSAASSIPLYRYNDETIDLLIRNLNQWQQTLQKSRCEDTNISDVEREKFCGELETYVIEVGFENIPDPERRRYFEQISTSFKLPDQEVDDLRVIARELITESPTFQSLVDALNE